MKQPAKQPAKKSKQPSKSSAANKLKPLADYESNPFNVLSKGWDWLFRYNRKPAIVLLLLGFLGSFSQLGSFRQPAEQQPETPVVASSEAAVFDLRLILVIIVITLVFLLVLLLLSVVINGTLSYIAWKTSRGETTTFTEAIKAMMSKFWVIAWVYVLSSLKIIGGLLLFVIPGLRALIRYKLVLFPVFEENLKGSAALERIKTLSHKHLLEIFGASSLASIIPFVSLPMETGSEAVLFRQLKDLHDSGASTPKTHWLNYATLIGIVLFISAFLLIGLTRTAA